MRCNSNLSQLKLDSNEDNNRIARQLPLERDRSIVEIKYNLHFCRVAIILELQQLDVRLSWILSATVLAQILHILLP